eukprot:6099683-Amphidinium_carterae.1
MSRAKLSKQVGARRSEVRGQQGRTKVLMETGVKALPAADLCYGEAGEQRSSIADHGTMLAPEVPFCIIEIMLHMSVPHCKDHFGTRPPPTVLVSGQQDCGMKTLGEGADGRRRIIPSIPRYEDTEP